MRAAWLPMNQMITRVQTEGDTPVAIGAHCRDLMNFQGPTPTLRPQIILNHLFIFYSSPHPCPWRGSRAPICSNPEVSPLPDVVRKWRGALGPWRNCSVQPWLYETTASCPSPPAPWLVNVEPEKAETWSLVPASPWKACRW